MGVGEIAQEEYIGKTGRKKTIMGESPRNTHMSRWGRGKKPEEEGPEREKGELCGWETADHTQGKRASRGNDGQW